MACALTSDLTPKACKTPSGVSELLVMEYASLTGGADGVTYTSNVVTALARVTGKKFRRYQVKAGVSDMKVNGAGSGVNGSKFYSYEVNTQILGIDTATQEELDLILANTLIVIVKLNDNTYWMVGQEHGMDVVSENFETGVSMGDFMGDKIQLTGQGTLKAKKVDSELIVDLLTPAA